MKIMKYFVMSCGLLIATAAAAQEGVLMRMSDFKHTDMLKLSQTTYGFSTARVSAMGGAYTSLGADLGSMTINPAGLGMYRGSDFGFSPAINVANVSARNAGFDNYENNHTRFSFNNIGLALNIYNGSGNVTSVTFGFGYTKQADFNYKGDIALPSSVGNASIADVFVNQLYGQLPSGWLGSDKRPYENNNIYVNQWGAVLAYQTALLDPVRAGDENKEYTITAIEPDAVTNQYLRTISRGYVGEYSLSAGMNINNILYLGLTIGFQDIYWKMSYQYDEIYENNNLSNDHLNYMLYDQHMKMSGGAINFKFGAIVRPVNGLRIGLAVHTPSIVNIDREYSGYMQTRFFDNTAVERTTYTNVWNYDFTTPPRLLVGASYELGQYGIISFDYERIWYNGMRHTNTDTQTKEYFKSMIKNDFAGANNFRAGLEIKPIPQFAVRLGYAYYGTPLKDDGYVFSADVATKLQTVSGGIGYRGRRAYVDLTYSYSKNDLTQYDLFYWDDQLASLAIDSSKKRHNIIATIGFRF